LPVKASFDAPAPSQCVTSNIPINLADAVQRVEIKLHRAEIFFKKAASGAAEDRQIDRTNAGDRRCTTLGDLQQRTSQKAWLNDCFIG